MMSNKLLVYSSLPYASGSDEWEEENPRRVVVVTSRPCPPRYEGKPPALPFSVSGLPPPLNGRPKPILFGTGFDGAFEIATTRAWFRGQPPSPAGATQSVQLTRPAQRPYTQGGKRPRRSRRTGEVDKSSEAQCLRDQSVSAKRLISVVNPASFKTCLMMSGVVFC